MGSPRQCRRHNTSAASFQPLSKISKRRYRIIHSIRILKCPFPSACLPVFFGRASRIIHAQYHSLSYDRSRREKPKAYFTLSFFSCSLHRRGRNAFWVFRLAAVIFFASCWSQPWTCCPSWLEPSETKHQLRWPTGRDPEQRWEFAEDGARSSSGSRPPSGEGECTPARDGQ